MHEKLFIINFYFPLLSFFSSSPSSSSHHENEQGGNWNREQMHTRCSCCVIFKDLLKKSQITHPKGKNVILSIYATKWAKKQQQQRKEHNCYVIDSQPAYPTTREIEILLKYLLNHFFLLCSISMPTHTSFTAEAFIFIYLRVLYARIGLRVVFFFFFSRSFQKGSLSMPSSSLLLHLMSPL